MVTVPRWAPIDIVQEWAGNTATIVLTTNTPCHLSMYWTTKQPWVHRKERIVRGLTVPWDAYWCFAAWTENEQEEPGDTLAHTFVKPGWQYCETRWFCFRGTVEGVLSPSDSPIFSKHYDKRWTWGFLEPWTWLGDLPPDFTLFLKEYWTWHGDAQPGWSIIHTEYWTS